MEREHTEHQSTTEPANESPQVINHPRRPYVTPRLQVYGNVRELTHSGSLRVPCLVAPSWGVLDFLRGAPSAPTLQLLLRNPVDELARVHE